MPVYFENGYKGLGEAIKKAGFKGQKAALVCDTNTAALYAGEAAGVLKEHFSSVFIYSFPAGEENKTLASISELYRFLMERHFDRNDIIFALGGGVVGDMAGFAAATYLRGVSFVQLPTTLLSQADSSIGGKTGVDFMGYKNMVGAFHMPAFVYMNPLTLKTLDEEQYTSGMGEVLKSALLADEAFYVWLIGHMEEIMERDPETVLKMVRKTASIKEAIVKRDPTEKGERALLNLGHTIGHAIEKSMDFSLAHGHCVALGTTAAAAISHKRGLLSTEELYEIRDMSVAFGLPMFANGINNEEILAITKSDKKMAAGHIRFILLKSIGRAFIAEDVTDEELLYGIHFINGDEITYEA